MRAKNVGFVAAAATRSETPSEDGGARRLGILGLLYSGSLTLLLGMSLLAEAAGRLSTTRLVPAARPVAIAGIVLGVVVFAVAHRLPRWRRALILVFEITGGLVFSVIEALKPWSPGGIVGVSITSLWIIMCALLIPLPPLASLGAALAAAGTGPVMAVFAGSAAPIEQVYFYIPSFVAVAIAFIGARAIAQAGRAARLLGSYRLVTKIGQGGMGEVWRAEHHLLAHPAAVKLVRVEKIPDGDRAVILKRFEREAQITASLTSPHTVDLYDYGVTADGIVYYVMELIEGVDLEQMVERFGPLPAPRAVHFLSQACHSLAEAHAAGLIHRDIKPSNLLCCRAGLERDYVKVLDFGLVRPLPRLEGGFSLTKKGVVMGTPGFIAPEVALGQEIDHRSDLYSLACVGYYLLAGRHVFDLKSPMRALHDHAYTAPIELSVRADVPEKVSRVIMRCLAKQPADRPADAEALAGQLFASVERPWEQSAARRWWAENEREATA